MKSLAVIGNVNVDLILGPAAPWPKPGTEIMVDHDDLRVGGSAGNCALAWEGLGIDYQIAANAGDDEFGRWLRDGFGARAARWAIETGSTTLSVGITHPDGERTFFTTTGHLPLMSLANTLAALDGERLAGGYAVLCGSFLTHDLTNDYAGFFGWADARAITVALDTGWPIDGWTQDNCIRTRQWLSRSGIALLNEIETTTLADRKDPAEAARVLKAGMPDGAIVVVKRGPDGALAVDADGIMVSVRAPRVRVVDTIGAGDVFNAGFLAALAGGATLAESLAAGVGTASRAISTLPRRYDRITQREEA